MNRHFTFVETGGPLNIRTVLYSRFQYPCQKRVKILHCMICIPLFILTSETTYKLYILFPAIYQNLLHEVLYRILLIINVWPWTQLLLPESQKRNTLEFLSNRYSIRSSGSIAYFFLLVNTMFSVIKVGELCL
jgi:hypothetical protein